MIAEELGRTAWKNRSRAGVESRRSREPKEFRGRE
jgi:hypothetical protein